MQSNSTDIEQASSTCSSNGTLSLDPKLLLIVFLVLLPAMLIRIPQIDAGMPYFQREDEAHHFNRVALMVREGSLDPNYFHKPSFHFYLRIPVYVASFFFAVKEGHLKKVEEIKVRDPFGLGGWAFSASHPFMVKAQRAYTLGMELLCIALVLLICMRLGLAPPAVFAAGLLLAFSPDLITHSTIVGVDVPTTLLSLLTAYLALLYFDKRCGTLLFFCAVCAGLTVSTKYNALPIMALPVLTALLAGGLTFKSLATALLVPVLGFFFGSPFILSSIPLFMNQFGYEIYHYGVAGHVGHMREPGLDQLSFYLEWLSSSAFGLGALVFVLFGAIWLVVEQPRRGFVLLYFPLCFFLLMVFQKTNFTRNMHIALPHFALFVAIFVDWSSRIVSRPGKAPGRFVLAVQTVLALGICAQPLRQSWPLLTYTVQDSRDALEDWLRQNRPAASSLAASGKLWLKPQVPREFALGLEDFRSQSFLEIASKGYEKFACHPAEAACLEGLELYGKALYKIGGEQALQRIVKNPAITVFEIRDGSTLTEAIRHFEDRSSAISLLLSEDGSSELRCETGVEAGAGETHCWTGQLVSDLKISGVDDGKLLRVKGEFMSPWEGQTLKILSSEGTLLMEHRFAAPGEFEAFEFPAKASELRGATIESKLIRSPGPGDKRRLATAFRAVELSVQ